MKSRSVHVMSQEKQKFSMVMTKKGEMLENTNIN